MYYEHECPDCGTHISGGSRYYKCDGHNFQTGVRCRGTLAVTVERTDEEQKAIMDERIRVMLEEWERQKAERIASWGQFSESNWNPFQLSACKWCGRVELLEKKELYIYNGYCDGGCEAESERAWEAQSNYEEERNRQLYGDDY